MNSKKGFSLVELLIVIGIIAVLGGVMLTQFSGSTESALATSCLNNMRSLCNGVLAQASKDSYYPSAGPYKYLELNQRSEDFNKELVQPGWIGTTAVSCYHDAGDEGREQREAIEKGSIWRVMGGARSVYVCPSHTKHCTRGKGPVPKWSYAMNSYFGWDCGKAYAGGSGGSRSYGSGSMSFKFSSSVLKRSADKVLLFAEIPFVTIGGIQEPEFETGASPANDSILQYAAGDGDQKYNKSAEAGGAASEAIGFNHKSGQNYSAHVAFADGHCVKLMLPGDCSEDDLESLTTWLCTGQEYTFNGARYERVEE